MSTSERLYERAFVGPNWYIGSMSEKMIHFAGQNRVLLPDNYNKIVCLAQALQHSCHPTLTLSLDG